ncbi:MAG: hypothetical protein IT462_08915 [Planctomycetes bacterium]|nr:hypothetical protein [Planctomycetota bacterium]
MKRLLMAMVAAAALATPAALVLAQDAFKDDVDKTMKVADTNKDGKLSGDEAKSTYKEREDALNAIYRESIGKDASERIDEIYKKYDGVISYRDFLKADGDDDMTVTREELTEFYARTNTKHSKGPPKLSDKDFEVMAAEELDEMWPRLLKFDADKDGKLSREELIKFAASEMKESEKRMMESELPRIMEPPPVEKDGK